MKFLFSRLVSLMEILKREWMLYWDSISVNVMLISLVIIVISLVKCMFFFGLGCLISFL